MQFVNKNMKHLFPKYKIVDNFKIVEETKNGNLNQSTDEEVQILCNYELNEIPGESLTPS